MGFKNKLNYEYFLLPFSYIVIAYIAVIYFLYKKMYKWSGIMFISIFPLWFIFGLLIPSVFIKMFGATQFWESIQGTIYLEIINICIGIPLIELQKKVSREKNVNVS